MTKAPGAATEGRARVKAVRPALSLTEQVTGMLRAEITGGRYRKGEMLPSETSFATAFGVSRSVVREAVSRLKADGLVVSRQGLGVFVASTASQQPFQIDHEGPGDLQGVRQIVELRMGMEVEAAGLAAANRQPRHLKEMSQALEAMSRAVAASSVKRGVDADLKFHRAVCKATDNPHYVAFFDFLSQFLRDTLTITRRRSMERPGRIRQVQQEHEQILAAIQAADPGRAREAARRHVENTLSRLSHDRDEVKP